MCGIAGILNERGGGPVPFEDLRRMVAMLRHRGPDGYGLYRDDDVGLAHSRLSIIDLAGGAQPIHNEDESIWIVFNGEIFNYPELRDPLIARGHRFYTQSDTEVIVHSYEEYGERAWSMFNGQFAFAIWDGRRRHLWLVRDRVGILPLFYARVGDHLLFASEAKALFASRRLSAELDARGVTEVFTRWSAAAPSTVFKGVRSVPPATAIRFDLRGEAKAHRYWQIDFTEDPASRNLTLDEAADGLGEHLRRAVSLRLRADVPVGAYLSGGLDSSVIGRAVRKDDSSPLQTFAIRFEDPQFDETEPQRRMAGLLGTEHHEILCGAGNIRDSLPEVVWHCETPLLRTAPAPMFLLSGLVRRSGMKVVLTGEGADELLAGYNIFKENRIRRFWAKEPDSSRRAALLSRIYPYIGQGGPQQTGLWREFFRRGLSAVDHPFYSHLVRWQNTSWTWRVLSPALREGMDLGGMNAALEASFPQQWRDWTSLAQAQTIEIATFLSSYLLASQGDRVAMAHSVEVRYPFLDPDLIGFCARLPTRMKLRGLLDKVALRRLAWRDLPPEIWQRPKHPYRAPMTRVLFGGDAPEYVRDLLSPAGLARSGLADPHAASRLVEKAFRQEGVMSGEREEMALVGLLTLQLLGRFYVEEFGARAREARRALDECEVAVFEDRSSEQRASVGSAR